MFKNTFYNVEVVDLHPQTIKKITQALYRLAKGVEIHVGEMSMLEFVGEPDVVIVSSDDNVLKAYVTALRLNPRISPAIIETYS